MKIINLSDKKFMIAETGLGILYLPAGMFRDEEHGRWVLRLNGRTRPFYDKRTDMFGKLKSLAELYLFVMENGEKELLPFLGEKFSSTGLLGMYYRDGLNPHYHVQVYGDIVKIYLDKKKKTHREFNQAARLQDRLFKDIPGDLTLSLEKLNPYI